MADSSSHPPKYNVSFNASLTLPRHSGGIGDGIRFECSWNSAPDLSPSTIRRTLDGKGQSTCGGQQPPQPQFRLRSTTLQQTPSSTSSVIEISRPGWISVRKNSSSGYGSGDASPAYLAATLTLTSGGSGGGAGEESVTGDAPVQRAPPAYDRRCRSTCSITLQNESHRTLQSGGGAIGGAVGDGCNFPLKPRRLSEGEAWNSHAAVHRLIRAPLATEKCAGFGDDVIVEPATSKAATPAVPVGVTTEGGQKEKATRRVPSRNKQRSRSRPRTVHIDVYCTASESEEEDDRIASECEDQSPDTDESNTSSVYTVVRTDQTRVRHTRKKSGLPMSLSPAHSSKTSSKPLLSYRISAKELADAVAERNRKESGSVDGSILTPLEEELFRDLNLTTDSSFVWPDSDGSGSSRQRRHQQTQLFSADSFEYDDQSDTSKQHSMDDQCRTWRSPDQERRKKMLEQRKMQWRAAKALESVTSGYDSLRGRSDSLNRRHSRSRTSDSAAQPNISRENSTSTGHQVPAQQQLLNTEELMAKLCRHSSSRCRSASDRVLRRSSQRCPKFESGDKPSNRRVSVPMQSSDGHLLPPDGTQEFNRLSMLIPDTWVLSPPLDGARVKNRSPSPVPVPKRNNQQPVAAAFSDNSLNCPNDQVNRTGHESRVDLFKKSLMAAMSTNALGTAPSGVVYRGTLKKFGHHVGPSRNPNCSCAHCVDYFSRVKSLYY